MEEALNPAKRGGNLGGEPGVERMDRGLNEKKTFEKLILKRENIFPANLKLTLTQRHSSPSIYTPAITALSTQTLN